MIEISENLWVDIDPIGRILIGHEDRVVRVEIEEREELIKFITTADEYMDVQIAGAEGAVEEQVMQAPS